VAARAGGYRVETLTGEVLESPELVVAVPPWAAAEILRPLDAGLAYELATIPAAPIAVVATGFSAADLPRPLDGFGFLVPRGEGLRVLGCLWDSSIFRFRAAEGRVLLRTMIGGAHDPAVVALEPDAILAIVRAELRQVLGITAEPDFVRVIRHSHGIPQYVPGHARRLERIANRLAVHRGLHLAGFGYRGVAVNRVLEDANALAERITA
jgi:oxygen-dependent protoporphyrinogen oxidase